MEVTINEKSPYFLLQEKWAESSK